MFFLTPYFFITFFAFSTQFYNNYAMQEEIDLENQIEDRLLAIKKNLLEKLDGEYPLSLQIETEIKEFEKYYKELCEKCNQKNNQITLNKLRLEHQDIVKFTELLIKQSKQEISDINMSLAFCSPKQFLLFVLCMFLLEGIGITMGFSFKNVIAIFMSLFGTNSTGLVQGFYSLITLGFLGAPFLCFLIYMIHEIAHKREIEKDQWKFEYKIKFREQVIKAFEKLTEEQKEFLNSIKTKIQVLE